MFQKQILIVKELVNSKEIIKIIKYTKKFKMKNYILEYE
jgi:hypothetical protein